MVTLGEPIRCVMEGIGSAQFRAEHLGKRWLRSRVGDQQLLTRLIDIELLDRAIWCSEALWVDTARVALDGAGDRAPRFDPGTSPYRWLYDQFRQGRTFILERAERLSPEIAAISAALCSELLGPVQAKLFVTPKETRAFGAHFDAYELFVVQLAGQKRWRLYPPEGTDPLAECPAEGSLVPAEQLNEPKIDVLLSPGDVLYVPRGWVHDVVAGPSASWQVSFGCVPLSARTYQETECQMAARVTPELRRPLALPVLDPQFLDAVGGLQYGTKRSAPDLVAATIRTSLQADLPAPCGLLLSPRTGPSSNGLRVRSALLPVLAREHDAAQLSFNGLQTSGPGRVQRKTLLIPAPVVSLVETMLNQPGVFHGEQLASPVPAADRERLVAWLRSEGLLEDV